MTIERVTNRPSALPSVPTASPADEAGEAFKTTIAKPSPAEQVGVAGPLEDLQSGRIGKEAYSEKMVQAATSHLQGLRPSDLETLRTYLRIQVAEDPLLSELAQAASGAPRTNK